MDELFHYDSYKFQILKHIRGDRSQLEVSEILGYSFNQFHKWEIGTKSLSLFEFIDICQKLNVPVERMFKVLFLFEPSSFDETELFNRIYLKIGPANKTELAELLGVNQSTLYRWLKGNGTLDFSLFLMWIDKRTHYLIDSISSLIGEASAKEILKNRDTSYLERRHSYCNYPYMAAVQYYFTTSRYRLLNENSHESIAKETGLSIEQITTSIEELLKLDIIYIDDGKYISREMNTDIGFLNVAESARLAAFWNEKALHRFKTQDGVPVNTGDKSNMWTYRIVPIPESLEAKIKEKFSICISEIVDLLKESKEEPDKVKAIVLNYFDIQDSPTHN